jgi:UPF0755 protein
MSNDWYGPGGRPDRASERYDRGADFGHDGRGNSGNGSADWARQSRGSHRAPDPYDDPREAGRGRDPDGPQDPYAAPDPYETTDPYRGQDPYADPYQDQSPYRGRDDYRQDSYPPYGDDGRADQWQQRQDGYPGADRADSGPYRWQPPAQQDPYGGDEYADGNYQADAYRQDDGYRGGGQYEADPYAGQPDPYAGQADPYAGRADPYAGQADPYAGQADPYAGQADPYAGQADYRDQDYGGRYRDDRDGYQGDDDDYRGSAAGVGRHPAAGEHDEWDERQRRRSGFFSGFGDDPDGPARPRKRRRSKAPYIILPILLIILGGLAGGGYYVYHRYEAKYADYPAGTAFGSVDVTVPAGGSADSIAPVLLKDGVIAGTRQFVVIANASGKAATLQPGVYQLSKHMTDRAAWGLLLNPKSRVNADVTIPEGLRASKIIAVLAQKTGKPLSQFQAALKDTAALGLPSYAHGNPEGYLFPDTYDFAPGASALSMLQTMVKQFNTEAANIHLVAAAKKAKFSPAQVITTASLIEAEVNQSRYYPKVARVIDNKLNFRIPLQLDSTIAYITNDYNYDFTYAQLHTKSPYNTFLHTGLPPGPIDSPGLATIMAVLHPSPLSDTWTYFVTVNKSGLTKFTSSYTQFEAWSNEAKRNGV